jgi:hypothetical protein
MKYLPENGFVPHVICSSENGDLPGVPCVSHVPNPSGTAVAGEASRRAARFQRALLPYDEKLPWVPHAIAAADQALAGKPFQAVISTSPPLATHFAALRLKKRHKLKWIADFRDPLLGNPGRPRKWARYYDMAVQRWIFANCDAAVAVTDVVLGEWQNRYPQWAHKFHLIWNGFDPAESVRPEPIPPRNYRVLTHAGIVYHQRHPFWLAESMARLIERGRIDPAAVRLRLVGPMQEDEIFRRNPGVAALLAKGCLEYDGQLVSRAAAMHEVATADYLLILDITNLSNIGYTVPAKLYDYICIGRPILAFTPSPEAPTGRILQKSGVPTALVHPDDPADVVDRKLLDFLMLPTEPVAPSEWFTETFDGRKQAAALASILNQLL